MAILVGNNNGNTLVGTNVSDLILGNGGNDTLFGRSGNDRIEGGVGNDILFGEAGNDSLLGGVGSDRLTGGGGDDTLVGGLGRDFLSGGLGRDTFRFDDKDAGDATAGPRSDAILDLGKGDVIDLLNVDVFHFDGGIEPQRGGISFTAGADGNAYITWNTFNSFHDVEVRGVIDLYDLYWNHIRWYADDNYGGFGTEVKIAPGQTRNGTIENGWDEDWWRIDVKADHLYNFDLSSVAGAMPGLSSEYMALYDDERNWVASGYGNKTNPATIEFVAETSGTYYLQAWGEGWLGSYALGVKAVAYKDDYGTWDQDSRGSLSAGTPETGTIGHGGDQDAFAFVVEDGKTYTIDVQGASSDAGTLVDPYAFVNDVYGNWIAEDTDSGVGEDAQIVFTANEDATYYLTVFDEGYNNGHGTYKVTLTETDALVA